MKYLNKKAFSIVELVVVLGIVGVIGAAGYNVLKSSAWSGQKISRAVESDQLMMDFLNFRKKELQLTQQVPISINLIPPFMLNPPVDMLLMVVNPVSIPGITGPGATPAVNPALGSACHVLSPAGAVPIDPANGWPQYTNAGSGCKTEAELIWTGYSVNKRIANANGDIFADMSYVSACRALPADYPANFPNNVGAMSCAAGQTSFITDGILPGANVIFPIGNPTMMGTAPLAASIIVQRSGRTLTLKLVAVVPDGKGAFDMKTKEIAASIPIAGDPPPRVTIIR